MDLIKKGLADKDLKVDNKTYQRNLDMKAYSSQIKNRYAEKINKANKIK